jgi:hypothetical protein
MHSHSLSTLNQSQVRTIIILECCYIHVFPVLSFSMIGAKVLVSGSIPLDLQASR